MGARVQGLVAAVPVQDFQYVHQRDLLVQIRDDDYRAQVTLAEAGVAAAEGQLANLLCLHAHAGPLLSDPLLQGICMVQGRSTPKRMKPASLLQEPVYDPLCDE